MFTDDEYARHLSSSKLCLVTTGPADLVGSHFLRFFAGNRSLVICNRMSERIYDDMSEKYYVLTVDDMIIDEDERMAIVNNAYKILFSTVDEFYRESTIQKYNYP